jgi:hypothetical protein
MNRWANWRSIVIPAMIGGGLAGAAAAFRSTSGSDWQPSSELFRVLFFGALVLLVVLTSVLGKPKRRGATTHFPPPLGAKMIVWASLGLWIFLLLGPIAIGMYWLAALFALGPAYTIWRWPETIEVDEFQVSQCAWCHPRVSIRWEDITSIARAGDYLVLQGQNGDKIKISDLQVGADQLFAEIMQHASAGVPR